MLLGRLRPEFFGHIFGHNADEELDVGVVREKFQVLTDEINAANPLVDPLSVEQTAVCVSPWKMSLRALLHLCHATSM